MGYDLIIIGAGVSGIFSAISKNNNKKTLVLEKNDVILKKFMISGKGKSNITNTSETKLFLNNLIDSNKFLYPAIHSYNSSGILKMLDDLKIKYYFKEPTRVHLSDSNVSFRKKILNFLNDLKIDLKTNTEVIDIKKEEDLFVISTNNGLFKSKYLIVATGGLSYKITGSTGDGYKFAKKFNHKITKIYPIGVGLHTNYFNKELQGISLDNVNVRVKVDNKFVYEESGPFIFTHYGIGGPVIRRISGYISKNLLENKKCEVVLSFLDKSVVEQELDGNHYLKQCFSSLNNSFKNSLLKDFDKNLDLKNINKNQRNKIISLVCENTLEITNTEPIDFAINTGGGIDLKEINPNSFESKNVKNLFFIGEVLDINPRTNGFNITVCYSTANKCMEYIKKLN